MAFAAQRQRRLAGRMSIYATLWVLKFPQRGDEYTGCEWVEVWAQAVPEHIGRPTEGSGCERGDPYASFLPSVGWEEASETEGRFRAVVFVTPDTLKGTAGHHPQEYEDPLLVLSGVDYRSIPFTELHKRLCDALRGDRPRVIGEVAFHGRVHVMFDDGSRLDVAGDSARGRSSRGNTDQRSRPWWRFW